MSDALILHHPHQLDIHKEERQDIMGVLLGWNSHFIPILQDTIISNKALHKGLYLM